MSYRFVKGETHETLGFRALPKLGAGRPGRVLRTAPYLLSGSIGFLLGVLFMAAGIR